MRYKINERNAKKSLNVPNRKKSCSWVLDKHLRGGNKGVMTVFFYIYDSFEKIRIDKIFNQ